MLLVLGPLTAADNQNPKPKIPRLKIPEEPVPVQPKSHSPGTQVQSVSLTRQVLKNEVAVVHEER